MPHLLTASLRLCLAHSCGQIFAALATVALLGASLVMGAQLHGDAERARIIETVNKANVGTFHRHRRERSR